MLVIVAATITAVVLMIAGALMVRACISERKARQRLLRQQDIGEKKVVVGMALAGSILTPVLPEIEVPAALFEEDYDDDKTHGSSN